MSVSGGGDIVGDQMVQMGGGESTKGTELEPEISGTTGNKGRNASNAFSYSMGIGHPPPGGL